MSHQEQEQEQEMLHLCLTGFYLRKPVKTLILIGHYGTLLDLISLHWEKCGKRFIWGLTISETFSTFSYLQGIYSATYYLKAIIWMVNGIPLEYYCFCCCLLRSGANIFVVSSWPLIFTIPTTADLLRKTTCACVNLFHAIFDGLI